MRPKHNSSRGSVLMYVLIVGAILLIGVSSMFSSVNMAITSDQKFYHAEDAEMAARSAIHMVLAKIKDGDFEYKLPLKYEVGQAVGLISFDSDSAGPYSTNNLVSSSAKTGWHGQLVPPKCIHLVSVGTYGSQKVVLEMMVNQTSFPWSVASNGIINGNDMEVFALNSVDEAKSGITEDVKQRSDILSNAAGQSITLSGQSNISGDAKAVGKVSLSGGSVVKGKTEENQDPTQITLAKRAEDYRPPAGEYQPFTAGTKTVSGWYVASGDTIIGDVTFEDGMIFVDGSVTVTGKIAGNGALVATKNITVTGSMNTSADLAALVAGGDISITGQGTTTSSFQGLILAEGSFKAKDTTLIGSALTLDKNGSVQLERVRTVAARDLTKIDLSYAVELKKAVSTNYGNNEKAGLYINNVFTELVPTNIKALEDIALQLKANNQSAAVKIQKTDPDTNEVTYADTPSLEFTSRFNYAYTAWDNYEQQVKDNKVVYHDIFQLDFNKFLKTKGGLRPLLQRVTPI